MKEYYEHNCVECGVWFAIEKEVEDHWRTFKKIIYCYNGHKVQLIKKKDNISLETQLSDAKKEIKSLIEKNKELTDELEVWRPRSDKTNEVISQ